MKQVNIIGLGIVSIYDFKDTRGGKLFWLYTKDGITKMPDPIFVAEGNYQWIP